MGCRRIAADLAAGLTALVVVVVGLTFMLRAPAPPASTGNTVWDRAFTPEVLEFIRVALVVVAAFLAAALVQRTILGKFGFKMGPAQLDEIEDIGPVVAPAVKRVGDAFKAELDRFAAETNNKFKELDGTVRAVKRLDEVALDHEGRIQTLEQK